MESVYVVMWESWDGVTCAGDDLYMSLDYTVASIWMHQHVQKQYANYVWDQCSDIWFSGDKYGWDKYYIDVRPLEEEL